jgi:hypothetical protein
MGLNGRSQIVMDGVVSDWRPQNGPSRRYCRMPFAEAFRYTQARIMALCRMKYARPENNTKKEDARLRVTFAGAAHNKQSCPSERITRSISALEQSNFLSGIRNQAGAC